MLYWVNLQRQNEKDQRQNLNKTTQKKREDKMKPVRDNELLGLKITRDSSNRSNSLENTSK